MRAPKFVPVRKSPMTVTPLPPSPVWWLCGNTTGSTNVLPGDTVYLHGNNFQNPAWVFLSGPKKGFISVKSVKPGVIEIMAPNRPVGDYDVWLYQGTWLKFPTPMTITTPKALGMDFGSNVVTANPPSGGDDYAYLQGLCDNLNNVLDPTGGPANTIVLQAGTYLISRPLSCLGHYGSHVYLKGQGAQRTFLKPTVDFNTSNGQSFFLGNAAKVSDLTADARGANLNGAPAFRITHWLNCNIFADPIVACVFMDGNDGPANFWMVGCSITGSGWFANGLKSGYVDNCSFFLDGYTESAMYLWSVNNVHVTNTKAQNYAAYNGQRGRIFCLAYSCSNIYLENLQTFALAGTADDYNCGEQIVCDGDQTSDLLSRMYVYKCKIQGRTDAYQWDGQPGSQIAGASCGFEMWIPCSEIHVNGLTVDSCISSFNIFFSDSTCKFENIKSTGCRIGMRGFGLGTFQNFTATGIINRAIEVDGNITLNNCMLKDAPIGLWAQNPNGLLALNNSRIYLGAGQAQGSCGIDPTASSVKSTLGGYSEISGFQKSNLYLAAPPAPA